jgi:hypothetical protein
MLPLPKQVKEKNMDFLLTHWHCVVPVLAIAAVLLISNRDKKKDHKEGGS